MHATHLTTCISLTSETTLKRMNVGVIPLKVSRYIHAIRSYTTYLAINEGNYYNPVSGGVSALQMHE